MNIVIAIVIFSLVIIIHELGHFLLAKKNGIGVTEFSVGMGPRIFTIVKGVHGMSIKFFASMDECMNREDWKERTKYSLKIFPLGGSCMMLGEDEVVEDDKAFGKKSVWARISVIFAGPLFNFLLAFLLALIIVGFNGYDPTVISMDDIEDDMPMAEAGFQTGDEIIKINGTRVHFTREIQMEFFFQPLREKPVEITVLRDGEKITKTVTPKLVEENKYMLGFGYPRYNVKAENAVEILKYSVYEVKFWIVNTIKSLGFMLQGKVKMDDMAGPVGIVDMIGDTYEASKPAGLGFVVLQMLNISLLISANLGVMNLLPIPALDGGRLVFLFLEALRGKPIDQNKEAMVHMIGLVALMILMVFVMFNDVGRIIGR